MDNSSRLRFLFSKYLRRQCTLQESAELIGLLQHEDADEALLKPMQALWDEMQKDGPQHNVDWNKMYSSVISSQERADVIIQRATTGSRKWYVGIAAICLLLVLLPLYFFFYRSGNQNKETEKPAVAATEAQIENDRQTIHLPDGSTVILNSESKLNYPSVFSKGRRDVYLSGEGFFDIRHLPSQPFFVHTGKLIIRVVGTSFNVKAYPHQENIEVTVTRGKVQVMKENKTLGVLSATQQISFVNETEDIITRKVDTLKVIAWKPAEIFFNDITMEEAANRISQRFKMQIEFADPAIKTCRVTATFSEDDLAEEIVGVICAVTRSGYKIIDDKIIIDGKGCN